MNKLEIIYILQSVRDSHSFYLNDGQVLIDGINLDRLEEPVKCEDCHFSHWCEEHQNEISAFPWFQELKENHIELHNKFSVLFFESMRKYNPKTFDQLLVRFETLKSEANTFNGKLDDIETELHIMTDDEFTKIVSNETAENEQEMKSIDIEQYDDNDVANLDKESLKQVEVDTSVTLKQDIKSQDNKVVRSEPSAHEYEESTNTIMDSETSSKHITLKEQNIVQLQQKKELSQLELVHLEETQKLTLQSAEQLEQSYCLKQQEIELEQKDNEGLIAFKDNARNEVLDNLNEITEIKLGLKDFIHDLETKISDAQVKQDMDKSSI